MDQISVSFKELDELYGVIEDTFDTCSSSREEIYWLIAILKLFLNSPNKYTQFTPENTQINYWMYSLYPIVEGWKAKYHHSAAKLVRKKTQWKKDQEVILK